MNITEFVRKAVMLGIYPAKAAGSISGAWPVGAVFISAVSTDPATLLGFGTWAAIGAGRVLVGRDANDTDFDVAGETGGAKTIVAAGSVAAPTFTGSQVASNAVSAGTPAGTVSQPTLTMNSYTPAGTNGQPTFTGNAATLTGSVSQPTLTMNSYTPAGTVSQPTFSGSALAAHAHELPLQIPSTTTTRQLAAATFGTGTSRAATAVSTTGTANVTSAAVALSEAKSAGTPAGTVSQPTFTGNAATLTGSVSQPTLTMNSYTPGGTVSVSTFTGNAATLTGSVSQPTFTGSALGTHQHNVTAAGTVSQPAFTGSATSVVQPYLVVYMWQRTA